MAGDGKRERSVVTDFGPRIEPRSKRTSSEPPPKGKQASRARRADSSLVGSEQKVDPARRTRPITTEAPPVRPRESPRESASAPVPASPVLPRAAAVEARRAEEPSNTAVDVLDEVLSSRDERLFMINEPDSPQSAAYRVLRHQVEAHDAQVIAVSSPTDGAGVSTTAANLALALCECRRAKVLLVEANTRRPTLARMFKFEPVMGFREQIERVHTSPGAPWKVTSFPICGLHIAALARKAKPEPLVDGPAFRTAIRGLAGAGYDRVIIDCASVLSGADVNLVQDAADGIILVARARVTTTRQMRQAIERLTPASIVGTILLGE